MKKVTFLPFRGRKSDTQIENRDNLLEPAEIRCILEGRLDKLHHFAGSPRLNATDPKGDTPLHLAARVGNLMSCDFFIRAGADPAALNFEQRTPADLAFAENHSLVAKLLSSLAKDFSISGRVGGQDPVPPSDPSKNRGDIDQAYPNPVLDDFETNGTTSSLSELSSETIWTVESVELLSQLWSEGRNANDIASTLGRVSRNAVIGKAHRLGLGNKSRIETVCSAPVRSDTSTKVAPSPDEAPFNNSVLTPANQTTAGFELDNLDALLDFEAEQDPDEYFNASTIKNAEGTFVAVVPSAPLSPSGSDNEHKDWVLELTSAQISGDGIGSAKPVGTSHDTEHDFLKASKRGRQSNKRVVIQTGTRLNIDPKACKKWATATLANGWCSLDDINVLIALCEGNGDPFDLRINIQRIVEAAGIELKDRCSCTNTEVWDAKSDVSSSELAEAIEAALTRHLRLPGTQHFVMNKSDELQLLEPMIRAKQELHLALLASDAAVHKILSVFDSIRNGVREPSSVTLRMIIPARSDHAETSKVFSAVEELNSWWNDGRVMHGKKRREALEALETLDFSLAFFRELVRAVEEADPNGELASWLDTQIGVFEDTTDALIRAHLPYARRFAVRNVAPSEDPEDVFQVAFIGLQRSTRRFDPQYGARFVTYCTFWMSQALTRWRADEGSAIRVPVHRHGHLIKLDKTIDMLDMWAQDSVPDSNLASELEWPVHEVRQLRQIPRLAEYPDETDSWDEVFSIPEQANFCEQEEIRRIISNTLDGLPEREADVIRKRFGIGQDQEMTLEEIGQLYGVTRERIRQIEAKGLNQLLHPSRKRRLQTMLGI